MSSERRRDLILGALAIVVTAWLLLYVLPLLAAVPGPP